MGYDHGVLSLRNGDTEPPWSGSFEIDRGSGDGLIRLAQEDANLFQLQSRIRYLGDTGLENANLSPETLEQIREVSPQTLPDTDLASVPIWFRWFTGPYGIYTPAALIHDKLIVELNEGPSDSSDSAGDAEHLNAPISAQQADRYFRFMLKDLGLSFAKRWLMWAAVAFRTRYHDGLIRRLSVIVWVVLAILGCIGLAFAITQQNPLIFLICAVAPIPASILWGKQAGAGLIGAYIGIPWILPPALFAGLFYSLYYIVDRLLSFLFD